MYPPLGRLLDPGRPLSLVEEELPRSGLRVTRTWQLAWRPDGRIETWLGRRAQLGRGENRSGLAFDQLLHD